MTYLVSARRWRPQTFADLVGQEHISRTLSNAIGADRVAHAFLFTGLRGVGKTTAARILAKALNCEKGPAAEPCNQCTNCREITEGRSVDVLEIDGASNTGVDDVREIIENVRYQPAKSKHKIYIIDEVHMLSNNAFNALLKTLEEPPPHVKFVFATTDPQKLPATVQSRCQRYDFRRIPLAMVVERLREIAAEQKLKISDPVLFTLAREGEGSMRDAQSLLDQIAAGAAGKISDEEALSALGLADRRVLYEIAGAVIESDAPRAVTALDGADRLGCDMRRLTRDLLEHFRNLAVMHVSKGALVPDLPQEELETLRSQAKAIQPADADRCFRYLLQCDDEVGRSPYPKLVLEMTVLRLAAMEPLVPVDDLLRRLEALEGSAAVSPGGSSGGGPAAAKRSTSSPAPGRRKPVPTRATANARSNTGGDDASPSSPEPNGAGAPGQGLDAASAWPAFRAFATERMPTLGAHLETCESAELGEHSLSIAAPEGFRANYLRESTSSSALEELAGTFFGRRMRVTIVGQRREDPAAADGPTEPTPAERAEAAMKNPAVQKTLEILDGELSEVRQRRPRG